MEKIKKHKFLRIKGACSDFYSIFCNYKAECIICVLGFVVCCAFFKFVDGISLQSWALETGDAFFRGGFTKFYDILEQNLWEAPHGVINGEFCFSNILYAIWNLPVLLCHYIFKRGYYISFAGRMWGKLFLVLLVIAMGYVAYKIVKKVTDKPKNGMLAAVLIWGSVMIMASVGYAMQNEVIYMFYMFMGIYRAMCGKKNRSLIWLALMCEACPLMILFAVPVILYSSEKLRETLWRILALLAVTVAEIMYISTFAGATSEDEIDNIFKKSVLSTGIGQISIFAAILFLVYMIQWTAKYNNKDKFKYCLWTLGGLSAAMSIFSNVVQYRFMICTLFLVLTLTVVGNDDEVKNGLFSFFIFECLRTYVLCLNRSFLRLSAFPNEIKDLFGLEGFEDPQTQTTLFDIIKELSPEITESLPIIYGIAAASLIWLLYICFPKRKNEIHCPISARVLSVAWCSMQFILVAFVGVTLLKFNILNVNIITDDPTIPVESTIAINGKNYVEEYYRGKGSENLMITLNPSSTGVRYPSGQMLNLDVIDVDTGVTIATESYDAVNIRSGKEFTYIIENVNIEKGKWYKFKFYSPETITEKEQYMYLHISQGTAKKDKHYGASVKNGKRTTGKYDIVSRVVEY